MSPDHERTEAFLKGIALPEYKSDGHREKLRAQILSQLETGRAGKGIDTCWKTVALLLGLLCSVAVATELVLHRYHFVGRSRGGSYHFRAEPETVYQENYVDANGVTQHVTVVSGSAYSIGSSEGDLDAVGLEQKLKDLEEIDALRQKNAREPLRVIDTEVNGKFLGRSVYFKYVLTDGRTQTIGEDGIDSVGNISPAHIPRYQSHILRSANWKELRELRTAHKGETLGTYDKEIMGKLFKFTRVRYVLSDGTEVILSKGDRTSEK